MNGHYISLRKVIFNLHISFRKRQAGHNKFRKGQDCFEDINQKIYTSCWLKDTIALSFDTSSMKINSKN